MRATLLLNGNRTLQLTLAALLGAVLSASASAQLTPVYQAPIPNVTFAQIADVEIDAAGNAYVLVNSLNSGNDYDVLLVGYRPDGNVAWTWTLAGNEHDIAGGLALDAAGNYYLVGWTGSDDLPLVNPIQPSSSTPQYDAFMFKLNQADRSIAYGTLLGGVYSDRAHDVVVNAAGEAIVVGQTKSVDFPVTADAYQEELAGYPFWAWFDAFIVRISADGTTLQYSSFLGGYYDDYAYAVQLDANENIYIAGNTENEDFPVLNPVQNGFGGGGIDGYVAILSPDATTLQFSSWVGGDGADYVDDLALDAAGGIYVTGDTRSAAFPTTLGSFQPLYAGEVNGCEIPFGGHFNCDDAFVTKLAPAGAGVDYSTYLGGTEIDEGRSVAVDSAGRAYVAGHTRSPDLTGFGGSTPIGMFVAGFDPTGSALDVAQSIDNGTPGVQEVRIGVDGDIYVAGPFGSPSVLTLARFAAPFASQNCAGDSDCDGDVDFDDISYFVDALGDDTAAWYGHHMLQKGVAPGCSFMTNDTDRDGDVDFDDITPFVNRIGALCN